MNFHVLTLFPEMIENGMNTSITGRAITKGLLTLEAVNIRDYAFNKHQKVDDYTYGGGAGMLMQAEPVYLAYEAIANRTAKKPRVVYLTLRGRYLTRLWPEKWRRKRIWYSFVDTMRELMSVFWRKSSQITYLSEITCLQAANFLQWS